MEEKPYLVTGAAGFVGSFMVKLLSERGIPTRAMMRKKSQGRELIDLPNVEVIEADLCDEDSLRKAVDGVQGVYHIAALFRQAGHPDSVFREVNVNGTRRLLDLSIAAGVSRFIHCSTVGVLGHIDDPPATEETPYNPGDIYQETKMEGEQLVLEYLRDGLISGVVIRPAMIYGPGDERTLKLFRMVSRGKFFYVGKGLATVHWIDVRDLVKSFHLAMNASERNGEVYIISGEKAEPLRTMCEIVARELGVKPPWLHLPVKPMQWLGSLCEAVCTPIGIEPPIFRRRVDFFTKDRSFDSSKARAQLGFEPAQTFEAELRDIISEYKLKQML